MPITITSAMSSLREPHQPGRDERRHPLHLGPASDRDGERPETIAAVRDVLVHEADIDERAEQAVCRRLAVAGLTGNVAEGEPARTVAGQRAQNARNAIHRSDCPLAQHRPSQSLPASVCRVLVLLRGMGQA
jgi:hypothetical protein